MQFDIEEGNGNDDDDDDCEEEKSEINVDVVFLYRVLGGHSGEAKEMRG